MLQDADVLVIGGGAAGLMCAMTAGARGLRVRVIEHANRCGKKILMSGGGRCNFTNLHTTPSRFLSANPHFCKSALARYTPQHFVALVERHGIAYHEKELGQLFCDDSSKQIVAMLLDECAASGVEIHTQCAVKTISHEPESDRGRGRFRVLTSGGVIEAPALVVATGGLSIPSMGASGFGYELARQFGHTVLPTRAGLVPLTLSGRPQEQWCDLSGVSLPIRASCGNQHFEHALLLTHRGLSGPAILQISSYWQPGLPLRLDLLPHGNGFELLRESRRTRPRAELQSVLSEWLPRRFAERWCTVQLAHAEQAKATMATFSDSSLRTIADALHHWPCTPSGSEGYRTAEVTLGGVDTREVSSSTMQSQRIPGLYFVGEVLDVTGWLGGYNFQWAWASGHAAGLSV